MNYGIVGKHSSSFIYVKEGKNELLKGSHSPLSSNHLKISQADSNQQWGAIHFIQTSQDIFASIHIPPIRQKNPYYSNCHGRVCTVWTWLWH